jgi:putative RecB family exonuclease
MAAGIPGGPDAGEDTVTVYSYSRLAAFESCPRQYWYTYVGKVEVPEVETVEAFLGKRVHETLEEVYRQRLGGRTLSEEETLAWFEAAWEAGFSDRILVVSAKLGASDYARAGREALASYHRRYRPFDQARTVGLEVEVRFDLDPAGTFKMCGFIDRLAVRSDGTYEIHDYKTGSRLPTQARLDRDKQLALYQIGLSSAYPEVGRVELVWHYLRFDAELVSTRSRAELDRLRAACIAEIQDIESCGEEEASFPTRPTRLCPWCAFTEICPATGSWT